MSYRVEVTDSAEGDADAAYQWLAERTIHAAAWFNGLEEAIAGLAEFPARWPLARESEEFKEPIRQLLYGNTPQVYRVLFIVRLEVVYVLHVRHGARETMQPGDVIFPPQANTPH